jgi:hypothetical protein
MQDEGAEIIDAGENTSVDVIDNAIAKEKAETVSDADKGDADDGATDDKANETEKLKKALKKKNRYTENLRARLRALESEHEKLKSTSFTKEAPKMEGFESVMDYMKAENQHFLDQKFSEHNQQQQLSAVEQQKAALRAQQDQHFEAGFSEIVNSDPAIKSLMIEAMPAFQNMPKHVEEFLYEIDNAPAAVYALVKEGRLQDVFYMHPQIAAAELVAAQARGEQYLQKPVTQAVASPVIPQQTVQATAHKPMTGVKGAGKPSTSPATLKGEKILKWLDT